MLEGEGQLGLMLGIEAFDGVKSGAALPAAGKKGQQGAVMRDRPRTVRLGARAQALPRVSA